MQRVVHESGVVFYRSERLASMGVRHAFSTRLGGVSNGRYSSLNFGHPLDTPEPDLQSNIDTNRHRLSVAAGLPAWRCSVKQVHGCDVVRVVADRPVPEGTCADGLISSDPRRCVEIRTADCAAILMASAGGRVIAAVHAGWRGVVAGAVSAAARQMASEGTPAVAAAVFPCISFSQFEVGSEVVHEFRRLGLPAYDIGSSGKGRAGVAEGCVMQLQAAGISGSAIDASEVCTFVSESEFFSHRRDRGRTGRMALLAAPNPGPDRHSPVVQSGAP